MIVKDSISTNAALLIFIIKFLKDCTMTNLGVWKMHFHALLGLYLSLILILNFLNFIGLGVTNHSHVLASFLKESHFDLVLVGKYFKRAQFSTSTSRLNFMGSLWKCAKCADEKHLAGQRYCSGLQSSQV